MGMPDDYCELHAHTNFSFLDGATHPEELIARAAQLALPALAITDHAGLYAAVRAWKAAQETETDAAREAGLQPVRPIIGLEITIPRTDDELRQARRGRKLNDPLRGEQASRGWPGEHHAGPIPGDHLVLLARDVDGYTALSRLASRGHLAGEKQFPVFEQALVEAALEEARGHLFGLSGCRNGQVPRLLLAGERDSALEAARAWAARFGDGDFAVELSHHLQPDDDWLVAQLAELAERGRPADGRHQRGPLRRSRRPSAPGRARLHPPRRHARRGARAAAAERGVPAQIGRRAGAHRRRTVRRAQPPRLGGGNGAQRGHRRGLPPGARLRALSVSGVQRAEGGDRVLISLPACPRRLTAPLPADYQARAEPAHPRARGHRSDQPRRVLPDRVGPHGVRSHERHHRPGTGERRRLDRGLLPGHHQGRPDRAQAPLRALHQRGARAARHRHRLRRQPARGGDPVPLHQVRRRSRRHGLHHRHLSSSKRGARGGQGARVSRSKASMRWPRRSTPAMRPTWRATSRSTAASPGCSTSSGSRWPMRPFRPVATDAARASCTAHGRFVVEPATAAGDRPQAAADRSRLLGAGQEARGARSGIPSGQRGRLVPAEAAHGARRIGHDGQARVGNDEALRPIRGAGRRGAAAADAARQRLARPFERTAAPRAHRSGERDADRGASPAAGGAGGSRRRWFRTDAHGASVIHGSELRTGSDWL